MRKAQNQVRMYARLVTKSDKWHVTGDPDVTFEPHPPLLFVSEAGTELGPLIRLLDENCPRRKTLIHFPSALIDASDPRAGTLRSAPLDVEPRNHLTTRYFRQAFEGILFIPKIGSLRPDDQAMLYSVLKSDPYQEVGADRELWPPDVVVAASDEPGGLEERVSSGGFREELYRRFHIVEPVVVPPLRERREEIPCLIQSLLVEQTPRWGLNTLSIKDNFSEDALVLLVNHEWRLNDEEIKCLVQHFVFRWFIHEPRHVVAACDVEHALGIDRGEGDPRDGHDQEKSVVQERPEEWPLSVSLRKGQSLHDFLEDAKRTAMEDTLRRTGGNKSEAARLLGISRNAFY